MKKILAINGSYRQGGITDQIIDASVEAAGAAGAEIEVILLREYPIEFCNNCRACTQNTGELPGLCVFQDGMTGLLEKIEQADAYILASPTNFYSVTAIFKRFMERLVVYAYWPWDLNAPKYRKADNTEKKAILVSSCAAPGILGRWMYSTHSQLKLTAKTIGAKPVGAIFTGRISKERSARIPERTIRKVRTLITRIV